MENDDLKSCYVWQRCMILSSKTLISTQCEKPIKLSDWPGLILAYLIFLAISRFWLAGWQSMGKLSTLLWLLLHPLSSLPSEQKQSDVSNKNSTSVANNESVFNVFVCDASPGLISNSTSWYSGHLDDGLIADWWLIKNYENELHWLFLCSSGDSCRTGFIRHSR